MKGDAAWRVRNLSFSRSWVILLALSLLGVLLSMFYIVFGQTIEPKGSEAARQIYVLSPDLGNTVKALVRVLGLSYLVSSVLGAAIASTSFRRGEMWAWYAFWVFPGFFIGDIINNLSISGTGWLADIPFLIVLIATLLVSPQFETLVARSRGSTRVKQPPG